MFFVHIAVFLKKLSINDKNEHNLFIIENKVNIIKKTGYIWKSRYIRKFSFYTTKNKINNKKTFCDIIKTKNIPENACK